MTTDEVDDIWLLLISMQNSAGSESVQCPKHVLDRIIARGLVELQEKAGAGAGIFFTDKTEDRVMLALMSLEVSSDMF